jgi:hypothetical protein
LSCVNESVSEATSLFNVTGRLAARKAIAERARKGSPMRFEGQDRDRYRGDKPYHFIVKNARGSESRACGKKAREEIAMKRLSAACQPLVLHCFW